MNVRIEESWRRCLQPEFDSPYFAELAEFVRHEYASCTVYPPARRIFHAFDSCPFDRVRAVIIGQDPYHEPGQYYGLCFSVLDGVPFPPSLVNIFREIESDLGKPFPSSGRLERWADQGVLLINAILTVRAHQAGSHRGRGWERFTDAVIRELNERKEPRLYAVGRLRPEKGRVYRPFPSLRADGTPPFASVCRPGIFRLPALQQGERLSARSRNR